MDNSRYKEPSEAIKLIHAYLSDPEFSFNYFNRHKTNADGNPWKLMDCQLDYSLGPLISNQIVIASGRDCGKCLISSSKILLKDGTYSEIGNFINQWIDIESFNEDTRKIEWSKAFVTDNGEQECVEMILENGLKTTVTKNHPFLINNGNYDEWIEIRNLNIGDKIVTIEQDYLVECDIVEINNVGVHPTVSADVDNNTHIVDGILSHNSSSLESMMFRVAITNPNKKTAYIVLNEKHMRGVAENLEAYFNRDDFTRSFYTGYIKKERKFYLNNGHTIEIRIVGQDNTGAKSLVALHVDWMIVDEAQLLKRRLLGELMPGLNKGGILVIAGVPNDIRDTILYKYCSDPFTMYYKYKSEETERWDEEKERKAIDICKGKNTILYKQLYLAEWNDALEAVFRPSKLVEAISKDIKFGYCNYVGEKAINLIPQLNLPVVSKKYDFYIIGGDMGHTERSPLHASVLGVYEKKRTIDGISRTEKHYDLVYRLQIAQMSAYDTSKVWNYLMDYFGCRHACLDAQNYGDAIYKNLINDDIFPDTYKRNLKYVIPLLFSSTVVTGTIKTFNQTTQEEVEEEQVVAVKVATTDKLVEILEDDRFHIAYDDAGQTEFSDVVEILQAEAQKHTLHKRHIRTYTNQVNDHCFVGDTLVTTDKGDVAIKDIRKGDMVLTRHGHMKVLKSWKTIEDAKVTKYIINGEKLICTSNHKILINNKWTSISELVVGDIIMKTHQVCQGYDVTVNTLEIYDMEPEDVYDITVDNHHEFFANNILVHNCSDSLRCCAHVIMHVVEQGYVLMKDDRDIAKPIKLKKGLFKQNKKFKTIRRI